MDCVADWIPKAHFLWTIGLSCCQEHHDESKRSRNSSIEEMVRDGQKKMKKLGSENGQDVKDVKGYPPEV